MLASCPKASMIRRQMPPDRHAGVVTIRRELVSPSSAFRLDVVVLSRSVLEFVWRGLRLDKDIRSGSEVNRLVSELLG